MKKLALAAWFCVAWAVTCWAQTALRPDQISPATPDLLWGPNAAGTGYQMGSTVPWRTSSSTTPTFSATDAATIVELTGCASGCTSTLPDATATGPLGSGFGFAIQVGAGTLTLNRTTASVINGLNSLTVGPYQMVQLLSQGSNWYAVLSAPTQYGTVTLYGGTLSAAASFVHFATPRTVIAVTGRVDVPSGATTGTLDVYAVATGAGACASGTKLNSTSFNLNGAANSNTNLGLNGGVTGISVGAASDVCFVVATPSGGSITNAGSQRLQVSFR